jgi:hypothetical protein
MKDWIALLGFAGIVGICVILMIPTWLLQRDERRERKQKEKASVIILP